eukprot:917762-Rhodomonas_salina.1
MGPQVLGTGQYSTVKLGKNLLTNELVALKIILKTRLDADGRQLLVEEVRISQVSLCPEINDKVA